jgi:membrane protein YqaA with SNARE-associated domain
VEVAAAKFEAKIEPRGNGDSSMIPLYIVIPGWKLLRSLGGVGLVILGVVDSSVIPTFGSLDALTAVLAVKNQELWPYYAAASTLGSLMGAYITYRVSLRAGEQWLEKRIGTKRSRQVQDLLRRWGFAAVFVSCVAPPPFPTSPFFIGAGALRYSQGRFISAVFTGRALRYALIGFLAAKYSHTILRFLRHPRGPETDAALIAITLAGFVIVVLSILLWRQSKIYFQRSRAESAGD